jgi:hypothetical protein
MSVTHPNTGFASVGHRAFTEEHPQLTPFLAAVAIAAVSIVVFLALIGLPA